MFQSISVCGISGCFRSVRHNRTGAQDLLATEESKTAVHVLLRKPHRIQQPRRKQRLLIAQRTSSTFNVLM